MNTPARQKLIYDIHTAAGDDDLSGKTPMNVPAYEAALAALEAFDADAKREPLPALPSGFPVN